MQLNKYRKLEIIEKIVSIPCFILRSWLKPQKEHIHTYTLLKIGSVFWQILCVYEHKNIIVNMLKDVLIFYKREKIKTWSIKEKTFIPTTEIQRACHWLLTDSSMVSANSL